MTPVAAPGGALIGEVIDDRYRIRRLIGRGGMGAVYEAEAIRLDRLCAFKVLLQEYTKNDTAVERFRREAQVAARVKHPHVVEIFDTGTTEHGLGYIAMELLRGESLEQTLHRERRIPWPRARHMLLQICRALAAAHAKHIVHRDMKPENCFRITQEGDSDFIKVLDFGIAKLTDPAGDSSPKLTASNSVVGTYAYMAYEQVSGQECDHRVDVWAVGVILYELLTGVLPFRGSNQGQIWTNIVQHTPPPLHFVAPGAGIPEAVEAVVRRALEKSRAARYASIEALAEDLAAIDVHVAGAGVPATEGTTRAGASLIPRIDAHAETALGASQIAAAARRTEPVNPHELTELQGEHVRVTADTAAAPPLARSTDVSRPPAERLPTDVPLIASIDAGPVPVRLGGLGRVMIVGFGAAALVVTAALWLGEDAAPLAVAVEPVAEEPVHVAEEPVATKSHLPAALPALVEVPVVPEVSQPPPPPVKASGKKGFQKKTPAAIESSSPQLPSPSPPPIPVAAKKLADKIPGEMAALRDSAGMRECFKSHGAEDKRLAVDVEIDADAGRVTAVTLPALIRGSALGRCVDREVRQHRFSTAPGEADYHVKQFGLNK